MFNEGSSATMELITDLRQPIAPAFPRELAHSQTMTTGVARARDHRERQIAEVLGRYELSHLAGVLGLGRLVSAAEALIGREPPESHTDSENLRLALEDLGPTFLKLGQLLSTRGDLLSPEYRAELTKLQEDRAPAVPSDMVEEIIARELDAHLPGETAFATFEAVPLACASVGQAHSVTLHDGSEAVVKVRRPHVVEDMERDFEIIQNFGRTREPTLENGRSL